MEQVEFSIEPLKIMIYTNIANSNDEMVEFNRSMLHIPKSTENDENNTEMALKDIPFFTADIEYPIVRLNRMNYHDRVNFFFNQKHFINILRPYYDPNMLLKQNMADLGTRINNLKTKITDIETLINDNDIKNEVTDNDIDIEAAIQKLKKLTDDAESSIRNKDDKLKKNEENIKNVHENYKTLSHATRLYVKIKKIIDDITIDGLNTDTLKQKWQEAFIAAIKAINENKVEEAKTKYAEAKDAYIQLKQYIEDEADDDWAEDDGWTEDDWDSGTMTTKSSSTTNSGISASDEDDDGTHYYVERNYSVRERITRKNIKTMLEILFPTKFPVINDIQSSYEYIQNQRSSRPFWFNPFQKHYFSYLTISGKTYTVKKTVWLNDILNHPIYQQIFIEYRKLKEEADNRLQNDSKDSENSISDTFKQPLTKVDNSIKDTATFIKFKNVMTRLITPLRISSNTYLQRLINDLQSTDNTDTDTDTDTTENNKIFYESLDTIYNKYINIKSLDNKKTEIDEKNIFKFINTGICHINIGQTNKATREVYFMIDLIDGEINDKNVSSIYCPYIGDTLGNQLEYLMDASKTNQNNWAVDKNRQIFSLSKLETSKETSKETSNETSDYKYKLDRRESNPTNKIGYKQMNTPNQMPISIEVINNFTTYILKDPTEIKEQIKKLKNRWLLDSNLRTIDITRVLESIQKFGDLGKETISIIIQWSNDINTQNKQVKDGLSRLKANIDAKNEMLNDDLNTYKRTKLNPQETLKLEKEIDKNNFLLTIVKQVQDHEKTKRQIVIMGGTKKRKTRPKKNTRRRRK